MYLPIEVNYPKKLEGLSLFLQVRYLRGANEEDIRTEWWEPCLPNPQILILEDITSNLALDLWLRNKTGKSYHYIFREIPIPKSGPMHIEIRETYLVLIESMPCRYSERIISNEEIFHQEKKEMQKRQKKVTRSQYKRKRCILF
jgi:hypothetical protein